MSEATAEARPCNRCGAQFTPLPWMIRNKQWSCPACVKVYAKKTRDRLRSSESHQRRQKEYQKKYYMSDHGKATRNLYRRTGGAAALKDRNTRVRLAPGGHQRQLAHGRVRSAIKSGAVARPAKCPRCGVGRPVAHHPDYARPLDIEWLCPPCHHTEHEKMLVLHAW